MKRQPSLCVASIGLLLLVSLVATGSVGASTPLPTREINLSSAGAGSYTEVTTNYRNPMPPIVDFLVDDGSMEYQFGLNTWGGDGLPLLGLNRFSCLVPANIQYC